MKKAILLFVTLFLLVALCGTLLAGCGNDGLSTNPNMEQPSKPTSNCGHKWMAATCEKPSTCGLCGQTDGEALGHNWQAATCVALETCSFCQKTQGKYSSHNFVDEECTMCGKTTFPTVVLNNYVFIEANGFDGYGSCRVKFDYEKIIDDYADRLVRDGLDAQYFGDRTPEMAAKFVFASYEPFVLAYEASINAKNGDEIAFSWNTYAYGIDLLKQVMKVEFQYDNFVYTIQNLEPLKEIDLFEKIGVSKWGISGTGSVASFATAYAWVDGESNGEYFDLVVDTSKNGTLSNGDTVHMSLRSDYTAEYFARSFGWILMRTEADVTLKGFNYYAHENPAEILDCLGGVGLENALVAIKEHVDVTHEDRTYEYVGAVYYYQDEGNAFDSGYNKNNQLLLIFHIDNGIVPGGWYTYLAPNNDVVIGYEATEDGIIVKRTCLDVNKPLQDSCFYYQKERYSSLIKYSHPITFEYDGVKYVGHQTIEDCIKAYELNELKGDKEYDHVIGDAATNEFVD